MRIKIRLLALTFLLLMPCSNFAQAGFHESFHMVNAKMQSEGSVIRYWQGEWNVASFFNSGAWFLALDKLDNYMSGGPVTENFRAYPMPSALRIMDLYVLGDTTYFCGSWAGEGVYGWFYNDST